MYLFLKRVCLYPYCQTEKLWTLKTMQRGGGVKAKGCYSPDKGIWQGRQTPKQMTSHVGRSLDRRGHGSLRLNIIEKLIKKSLLIFLRFYLFFLFPKIPFASILSQRSSRLHLLFRAVECWALTVAVGAVFGAGNCL